MSELMEIIRRGLQEGTKFTTVGEDEEDDDEYVFETWEFWLIVMVAALFMGAVIFYISYRQELCCGAHKHRKKRGEEGEEADIEKGKKLATKTFQDSKAFERLPQDVVEQHMNASSKQMGMGENSETTDTSRTNSTRSDPSQSTRSRCTSTRSAASNNMHSFVAAPRCVLCSKAFEIGENVTHTTACHHEYHETCLKKHWAKSKDNNGKCPVCKVEYVVEEVSPSKHFSASMHMSSPHHNDPNKVQSARELGPFEETEEEGKE